MPKLTSDEIDAMFDIDTSVVNSDQPDDYGVSNQEKVSARSFEDRVDDVKLSMETEEGATSSESATNEVSTTASASASTTASASASASASFVQTVSEVVVDTNCDNEIENSDNPLGLLGQDLAAYKKIQENYPQFQLYDGSVAFKDFYMHKLRVLKWILTSFPILPLKDMRKEVIEIKLNHQVGSEVVSSDLIRQKLDGVGACGPRLVTLIIQALDQFPIWKKNVELLNSKLAKDHDSKGEYKRNALVLEHMFDMSSYHKELEGFIDSANFADNFLKRTADNLSRQLSCVLTRSNELGYNQTLDHGESGLNKNIEIKSNVDRKLDRFDTIQEGVVISKTTKDGLVDFDFGVKGVEDDEFSKLG